MTTAPDTSRLERTLGVVLRTGALASTVLLAAGLAVALGRRRQRSAPSSSRPACAFSWRRLRPRHRVGNRVRSGA